MKNIISGEQYEFQKYFGVHYRFSIFFAASCFGDDPIYEDCRDHPRGPWCYQEKVEKIADPSLCENILKYWPKATGVHGWCYYQLALKQKNCALCQKIKKADIKKMCELDACK